MGSITIDDVQLCIKDREVISIGKKTTIVLLTLKNGFEIVGSASCVNPEDYAVAIGAVIAEGKAIDKVWELLGYAKQEATASLCQESEKTGPPESLPESQQTEGIDPQLQLPLE